MAMQNVTTSRWTGLDGREADRLRIYCRKKKIPLPRTPWEKARMFYEAVAKKPVPKDILLETGRPAAAPEMNRAAAELIEASGGAINVSTIKGTGPNGKILVGDVRKAAAEALPALMAAAGGGGVKNVAPKVVADSISGMVKAAEAEAAAEKAEPEYVDGDGWGDKVPPEPKPKPKKKAKAKPKAAKVAAPPEVEESAEASIFGDEE